MTAPEPLRAAIYARGSTFDQEPENQLAALRRYVRPCGTNSGRGCEWTIENERRLLTSFD